MKPEIKELWVEALRSGKYDQTKNTLRRGDSFCCLGVLCDLYLNHSEDFNSEWCFDRSSNAYFVKRDPQRKWHPLERNGEFLPSCVQKWAGIVESSPAVKLLGFDDPVQLSELNDKDYEFSEIATIIEKYL